MTVRQGKTVSLVLGAGGARGLAHIGVIRWLTANGYQIRSIAGSSIGALIGGIYASSKLEAYAEWALALERMEVLRLLDPAFGRAGLFKGDRLMAILRDLIGDVDIETLPVSFTAVAMELETGKEVWLREGKLFDAVRASIAIPLIFTPARHSGRNLVDGGLVNPVPIAPTLNDTTDLTIAVNVGGRYEVRPEPVTPVQASDEIGYMQRIHAFIDGLYPSQPRVDSTPGMIDVALRSMESMENTIARLKLAAYSPDITIEIPRNVCRIHEFWRAAELIALGRERTERAFAASHPASDTGVHIAAARSDESAK